ncbi:MAG: HDOD domain-containing protein, partial [Desulfobacterales bacterium]
MKTEYVHTGSFWVGSSPGLALEAVLGTCVGVVLYDPRNRVGGLHHILLPDPVYLDQNPERYASSGLPLFIHALCEKGAAPGNLKAQIAGGALVGKLNYHDFDLDIGGRTTERVLALLKHAQIPVENSVTGGVGGCRVRLELPAMAVKVSTCMWQAPNRAETHGPVDREQVLAAIKGLAPIPQIALAILQNSQDENYALSDLAQDLKQDQVLSGHTIKLANSALFKRVRQVDSIEGAVGLLGRDKIIKWVVQKAIDDLFDRSLGGYSLYKGGLFHHARKTARLCELIARASGTLDPNTAYLAGLLHD